MDNRHPPMNQPDLNGRSPMGSGSQASAIPSMLPFMPMMAGEQDEGDIRQLLMVIRRRSWIILGVALAVMSVTTQLTLKQKPIYASRFQVLVEPVNANDELSDIPSILQDKVPRIVRGLDYETQIQVLRSPELIDPVAKKLHEIYPDVPHKILYKNLLENLTIIRPKESKILEVRYSGGNPSQVQVVLDQLSKAYLKYSLDERQTNLRQGIQFIDRQLPNLQGQVDQLQDQLQQFRQRHDFIDAENQATQLSQKKIGLEGQKQTLEQTALEALSNFQSLQGDQGALAVLDGSPVYQQLMVNLRNIESEIAMERTRFQVNGRTMQTLMKKRDNLLPLLQQEAQRVVGTKRAIALTGLEALRTQIDSVEQAQRQVDRDLAELPRLIRQYTDLQRELQVASEALSRFRVARENLGINAAQTEIPWQLIEAPARPERPISPNVPRSLMLGFVASALLGLGAALLLEKLDNVYHSVDDLKTGTKQPLLGTLPFNKHIQDSRTVRPWHYWLTQHLSQPPRLRRSTTSAYGYSGNSESSFLEALRILHTNIRMLGSDRPIQSIIISSALPGDGKSTVSANLAQVATAMGQRVLIVDVDLRKPQVHDRLQMPNEIGLSNLIAEDLAPSRVIQPVMPNGNLFVITAGQLPPDPTKLLSSQKMKELMQLFEEQFDLIIYDAPPSTGLVDVSLIGQNTDGLVLVSRMGKTDRTVLNQSIETLKMARVSILGIVANGVRSSGLSGYRYYAYGYSQGSSRGESATNLGDRPSSETRSAAVPPSLPPRSSKR